MSQLTEREQGENTDEGKSGSGKDGSDDQDMESHSYASSSSCEDPTEPRAGVLSKDMEDVKKDIVNIKEINKNQEKRISELEEKVIENQQKISELEEKVNESERNLWLHGLKEKEEEDVRKRVIDICSAMVPEAADNFPQHIESVQRVGKRSEGKTRPVLIKFSDKSTKELLLKTSKSSEYHRSSHLKFGEELTAKDKKMRTMLWPQIEAARKERKTAYFDGAKAVIDGKEISEKTN